MAERTCSIEGCTRRHEARGWCGTHYMRWRTHGDPTARQLIVGDDDARFHSYVRKTDGGCWEWTGAKVAGYGQFSRRGRTVLAHRWSYERFVAPIPEGLVIDHLCRNLPCVNPAHLEPVTQRENTLRGEGPAAKQARQTHCIHGHELPTEPNGSGRRRQCLICKRQRDRDRVR